MVLEKPGERGERKEAASGVHAVESALTDKGVQAKLLGYARRLEGNGGNGDPQALVQDTLLRAWRGRATYQQERGDVLSWLKRIMHNTSVDQKRKPHMRTAVPIDEKIEQLHQQEASPLDTVIDKQLKEKLRAEIKKLPESQREVIELSLEGLSHPEIAEQLKIPLGTVKSRLRLVHEKLTKQLTLQS